MPRLPVVGKDDDVWGDVLNDFLSRSHNPDGTLQSSAIPDASATSKGAVQLGGDLGGTADSPTVPGLAGKYTLPAGGIPEADLASAVAAKLNSTVGTDADVASYIQDTNSSTYAALVALIQNIYTTSYTPMSVVGAWAGGSPPSGAYPAGSAAGDVVVVTISTNGGFPTPPAGWSTLTTSSATGVYYGSGMGVYAKVLTSTDLSTGITGWSAGGVSAAVHVLRGVQLPTDVLVQNGWTDSTTYQLPALTATDRAPKLVMTGLTSLANQTARIEYPAPYTDFVEFYTGGTNYVAQAVLQASTTASSFGLSDPNNHATWRTVTISLSLLNP